MRAPAGLGHRAPQQSAFPQSPQGVLSTAARPHTRHLSGTSLTCGRAQDRPCVAGGPVRAGRGGLPEERGTRRLLGPEACGPQGWPSGVLATGVIATAHTTPGPSPVLPPLSSIPRPLSPVPGCGGVVLPHEAAWVTCRRPSSSCRTSRSRDSDTVAAPQRPALPGPLPPPPGSPGRSRPLPGPAAGSLGRSYRFAGQLISPPMNDGGGFLHH